MPPLRHIFMSLLPHPRLLAGAALLLLAAVSCSSRYRLDMFIVSGEDRSRIKIEKTEYFVGVVLGDPESKDKVVRGDGNCLVLVTGARGTNVETKTEDIITFDRYDRLRIFLQLPAKPATDTISLTGRSFVEQLGRYELNNDERMYFPVEGRLVVDSVSDGRLFGSLDGRYQNGRNTPLVFQGKFKARIAE